MDTITATRASLKTQLQAAEDDIARLRAAIAVLEDKPQSAPARRQAKPKAETTTSKVVPLGKLVKIVSSQEHGISTTQLAKQTGGHPSTILGLLKENEGKLVRRTGERQTTRWFVI